MGTHRMFSSLIGASVSIAVGAVLGTASFNVIGRFLVNRGASISDAIALVSGSSLYSVSFLLRPIVAGILGGATAAKLSNGRPYLSALVAGLFVMLWSVILFSSPAQRLALMQCRFWWDLGSRCPAAS
jgi:hypothetical protein